jgi:hypothetical protein
MPISVLAKEGHQERPWTGFLIKKEHKYAGRCKKD